MIVGSLNFDLIVTIPMGHSIVDNIMFGGCLMITSYMEMLVDLVLLNLEDFDVILEMDWLVSFYVSINYFGKRVISIFLTNISLVLRENMWLDHCL